MIYKIHLLTLFKKKKLLGKYHKILKWFLPLHHWKKMFLIMKIIDLFIHLLFHSYFFIVIILSDFSH